MRRREFIAIVGGAAVAWPLAARAQQPAKLYRLGFIGNDPTIPTQTAGKAFIEALADNGFVEGKNIVIERRFAESNAQRSAEYVAELVSLNVDAIVASGANNILAAKHATDKIPIVMVNTFDPVGLGIVSNLALPEGNITGLSTQVSPDLAGKSLELLIKAVPSISRIAVLTNRNLTQDRLQLEVLEPAARSLNVALNLIDLRARSDLEGAFAAIQRDGSDAILGLYNGPILTNRKPIVTFANENRLPAMYPFVEAVEAGGLMSYGATRAEGMRRAAIYVAKILKGAKPSDLPIEQPTQFEFVINLKTARSLGIDIPPSVMLLADRLVE